MVVGNEVRELRSQDQVMDGVEWLVKEFELCSVGRTGYQQRFSRSAIA